MRASVEFLADLLDDEEPCVDTDDLEGEHRDLLKALREIGVLSSEASINPIAACPHCDDGVPGRIEDRLLCNNCGSEVEAERLLVWRLDRETFLRWLAIALGLNGSVRRVDVHLWQLGTVQSPDGVTEFFYCSLGELTEGAKARIAAYRRALVVANLARPRPPAERSGRWIGWSDVLMWRGALIVAKIEELCQTNGAVRFDLASGVLWIGGMPIGDIPFGSKEFYFLRTLARNIDHYVSYEDLKREILTATGSRDATEEATFCQKLKSRLKKTIPDLDRLLVTTNKGDGYRLRSWVDRRTAIRS